jgi:hypothetical protein
LIYRIPLNLTMGFPKQELLVVVGFLLLATSTARAPLTPCPNNLFLSVPMQFLTITPYGLSNVYTVVLPNGAPQNIMTIYLECTGTIPPFTVTFTPGGQTLGPFTSTPINLLPILNAYQFVLTFEQQIAMCTCNLHLVTCT